MNHPLEQHSSFVIIPHNFSAIRVFSGKLTPVNIEVKVSCAPTPTATEEETEKRAGIGFERLKFWFETILQDVILVDAQEMPAGLYDNTLLHTPGIPTDHLLATLFHSKISHILDGFFEVYELSISTSDTEGIETHFRNTNGYHLPDIAYYHEDCVHNIPWWERDTLEVCELRKVDVGDQQIFNKFSDYFGDDSNETEEADIIAFENE